MNNDTHEELVKDTTAYLIAEGVIIYGPRIAVIREPEEEMIGLLHIPDAAKRKEPKGTIVGIGMGVDSDEDAPVYGFSLGDQVMFTKYNPIGFELPVPGHGVVRLELMHVSDLYIGWRPR